MLDGDGMKKMKRVSIEVRHREVTITMDGSPLNVEVDPAAPGNVMTVCPTCGNARMTIVAGTEGDVPADIERIQRSLEQSGLHRQDAHANKGTGSGSPESNPT